MWLICTGGQTILSRVLRNKEPLLVNMNNVHHGMKLTPIQVDAPEIKLHFVCTFSVERRALAALECARILPSFTETCTVDF